MSHQFHPFDQLIGLYFGSIESSHPGWGPRTLLAKLKAQLEAPPSRSSIYRCLVRHRLIEPKPRRGTKQDYRRWERSRPMELWQMDVMGGIRTLLTYHHRQDRAPAQDHAQGVLLPTQL